MKYIKYLIPIYGFYLSERDRYIIHKNYATYLGFYQLFLYIFIAAIIFKK